MARARGTEVPYLTSCRVRDNDGVLEEDIIGVSMTIRAGKHKRHKALEAAETITSISNNSPCPTVHP